MITRSKRVLCATDGSHSADRAVDYAIDAAKTYGCGVVFATVNAVSEAEMAAEPLVWDSEMASTVDRQVRQPLEAASAKAKQAGLSDVTYVVLHGRDIAGNIVRYAADQGCDHIVVGSRGRTGLTRVLLGSIAEHVVRAAACPVTVVR
ncbi:MAG: putative universal stress protein [Gammaproteobacteria bacterium]|nr:putative universal stress protein [Gammaproteobacteria bacterium]